MIFECGLPIFYRMVQPRILIVSILLGFSCLLGHADGQNCNEDYGALATTLINTSDNKYQLSITFFPTQTTPPVFVNVIYRYDNTNLPDQKWLWSAGAFYFFQPLRIYQYTSLFFGNPEFRSGTVTLTLPATCSNAPAPLMETLTQRVRDILHALVPLFYSAARKILIPQHRNLHGNMQLINIRAIKHSGNYLLARQPPIKGSVH